MLMTSLNYWKFEIKMNNINISDKTHYLKIYSMKFKIILQVLLYFLSIRDTDFLIFSPRKKQQQQRR